MRGDAVEQVRDRTDIVELIGQYVNLRKAGKNFKGLCPFHQEKTPSFIVFPESQNFHCFGCGAGGDAFNFVMKIDQVEFRDALQTLAERAGVQIETTEHKPSAEQEERHARLYEVNRRAVMFYAHILWNSPHGEPGRALLERRGVDRATAERFQLGFAPERWDALLASFAKRGVEAADLIAAGLASPRDDGGAYDRFRNRLMFPIRDRDGQVVGFGARAMGDAQPKYLNSPQTTIFDKSTLLYGLDFAQDAIRRTREVVVVEGYMDAIAAHQHGFENVVASMGTALTEQQVSQVRRGVDRIILALDSDAAGQMATIRGLDVLRESLGEADRPVLDPRGLVRFERTLKADIRIVHLPEGKDPDELIRRDPDAWRRAIAEPVPLLEFYVDAVIGEAPPDDPREKSALVERLAPVLREIGDAVVQDHYVVEVARRLGVREETIRRAWTARPTRRRGPDPSTGTLPRQISGPEEHLFALLVRYPDIMAALLPQVPESDLVDARHVAILHALRDAAPEQIPTLLAQLPEELADHVATLQQIMESRPRAYPGQVRREGERALLRLRKERLEYRMRQLVADAGEAERAQDRETLQHTMSLIDQLKARYPEFYPEPSPYFRDARDTGA